MTSIFKKISILLFVFVNYVSLAQWNGNSSINNSICIQPFKQVNVKQVSDQNGGAIIVWEDFRSSATQTVADIYAQRISSVGVVMWTTNGVPICTDPADQSSPVIVTDSMGGAIIVWEDRRGTKRNLYAQRVDANGTMMWANNGVGVTLKNGDQKNPKLITTPGNGAIVFWQDSASVGGGYDIYGQRLNSSGAAQWPGGIGVGTGIGAQTNVKAQISNGNIFVTWQDKRNGGDYDIYVQKLDMTGAAQWTANGVNISNVGGTQSSPKLGLDNNGGIIVAWQDKRNGIDYNIYAQRVNALGIAQWAANGVAVCTVIAEQSAVDMTSKGIVNGAVFAWKDLRNGINNKDIYAQKLDLNGVAQWSSNGIPIANALNDQVDANVTTDGVGGAIICYQDSSSTNWDIKSQRINAAGNFLWSVGGVAIGTANSHQTSPSVFLSESGNSIYAFQDLRNGIDYDIYVYSIDPSGNPVAVGIKSINSLKQSFVVFPNPSMGEITFKRISNNLNTTFSICIYNELGSEILNDVIEAAEYKISQTLNSGIYFFRIKIEDSYFAGKFIIEK